MNTRSVSLDPETAVRELVWQVEARISEAEAALAGLAGAQDLLSHLADAVADGQGQTKAARSGRPDLYNVEDAAWALSLVRRLIARGELGWVKVGAAVRVPAPALARYLADLAEPAA